VAKRQLYNLGEIARRFGGDLIGDAATRISQVASLESATASDISFVSHPRFLSELAKTKAGAVIVGAHDRDATALPRIICANPYAYFARVSALLNPPAAVEAGVHKTAVVERGAKIADSASIGAGAYIGKKANIGPGASIGAGTFIGDGTTIGAETLLYANVSVYHGCTIGKRCIVHSGAVIGADGFGLAHDNGVWLKIPQIGGVVIGNDVEVGANTTIDRGALHDTVIEDGVKMDNQIQIAHNVKIGANTAIAACVGIAGSAIIGRNCAIGGAAMLRGHIVIADNVSISAGTLVQKEILEPGEYTGVYPFTTFRRWVRNAAHLQELDELVKRVRRLERGLESKKGGTS